MTNELNNDYLYCEFLLVIIILMFNTIISITIQDQWFEYLTLNINMNI